MKNLLFLEAHLRSLRLPAMLANYGRIAVDDADKIAYLHDWRRLKSTSDMKTGCVRGLPLRTSRSSKQWSRSISRSSRSCRKSNSSTCSMEVSLRKRNPILVGPTGVGKTHALTAIGLAACNAGYRVLFTTAAELCMNLITAKREERLKARLTSYDRYHLLLIDELGYVPFEREATDLLFQVISRRYERASVGLTTNLAFMDWTQVFPDPMTASAVVDRLVYHGLIFEFSGESHRLRTRQAAGRNRKAS